MQGTWGRGGVLGTWGRGSVFSHMPAAEPAKQIVGNPSDKAVFTFCNLFKDIEETRNEWPQLYIMCVWLSCWGLLPSVGRSVDVDVSPHPSHPHRPTAPSIRGSSG